jgi:hypothetical protein
MEPMVDDAARTAREMWTLYEPIHAVVYFTPEARAAFDGAGLRGFWRGYFGGRAAPLGPVGPAPVVALFFGFAPPMVARALPDVWTRATPERALQARQEGAVAALERLFAEVDPAAVEEVAALLDRVTGDLDCAGRALAAANAALPRPDAPLARVWQATTVLREHRGDAYVAGLVAADISPGEILAWRAALDIPRDLLQPYRGWTDEQWQAAHRRLVERGWLTAGGEPTEEGRARHEALEAATDRASAAPWRVLQPAGQERLAALLRPLAVAAGQAYLYPNPIGMPAPAAAS